jgi:hypothetical protein
MTHHPRAGFKLVAADWRGTYGTEVFTVGSTHTLPPGQRPILCRQGFHYCATPVQCLPYFQFVPGCHLVLVEVPPDAEVVGDGNKLAASALNVVQELPTATGLLTGSVGFRNGDVTVKMLCINGLLDSGDSDLPSWTETNPSNLHVVLEIWHREGREHRDGGRPSMVTYCPDTGIRTHQAWQPTPPDGIHERCYYPDQTLSYEATKHDGVVEVKMYQRAGFVKADLVCHD